MKKASSLLIGAALFIAMAGFTPLLNAQKADAAPGEPVITSVTLSTEGYQNETIPYNNDAVTTVTIQGSNFGSSQGYGHVSFSRAETSEVDSWSDDVIILHVTRITPQYNYAKYHADDNTVYVEVYLSTAESFDSFWGGRFGIVNLPDWWLNPPMISDVTVADGVVTLNSSETFTIFGQNFGSAQGNSIVSTAACDTNVTSWANTQIVFELENTQYCEVGSFNYFDQQNKTSRMSLGLFIPIGERDLESIYADYTSASFQKNFPLEGYPAAWDNPPTFSSVEIVGDNPSGSPMSGTISYGGSGTMTIHGSNLKNEEDNSDFCAFECPFFWPGITLTEMLEWSSSAIVFSINFPENDYFGSTGIQKSSGQIGFQDTTFIEVEFSYGLTGYPSEWDDYPQIWDVAVASAGMESTGTVQFGEIITVAISGVNLNYPDLNGVYGNFNDNIHLISDNFISQTSQRIVFTVNTADTVWNQDESIWEYFDIYDWTIPALSWKLCSELQDFNQGCTETSVVNFWVRGPDIHFSKGIDDEAADDPVSPLKPGFNPPFEVTETLPVKFAVTPSFKEVEKVDAERASDIQWLLKYGITQGTKGTVGSSNLEYSPQSSVNRGSMAQFLQRLAGVPNVPANSSTFSDVKLTGAGKVTAERMGAINWLASTGITTGCGGTKFCPNATVNRGSMAQFLQRFAGVANEPSSTSKFKDLKGLKPDRIGAINWLASTGITSGVSPTKFGPGNAVNRGSMAQFMHRLAHLMGLTDVPAGSAS